MKNVLKLFSLFILSLSGSQAVPTIGDDVCQDENQRSTVARLNEYYNSGDNVWLSVIYAYAEISQPSVQRSWSIVSAFPAKKDIPDTYAQTLYLMPGGPASGVIGDPTLFTALRCAFPLNANSNQRKGGCGYAVNNQAGNTSLVAPTCPANYTAERFIRDQTNQTDNWAENCCSLDPEQTSIMFEVQNAVRNDTVKNPTCYDFESTKYCRVYNEVIVEVTPQAGLYSAFFVVTDNPFAHGARAWLYAYALNATISRREKWRNQTGDNPAIVGLSMLELNKPGDETKPFSCIKVGLS
jgi:hypothetical protein